MIQPASGTSRPRIPYKPRILIVDDDADFGMRTAQMLREAAFRARFHRGPFGTLSAIRESYCDLVVLDVCMPELDGPALVKLIQRNFSSQVRVLLCSNMPPATLRRLADTLAVSGAVPKGAVETEMINTIRTVLGVTPHG